MHSVGRSRLVACRRFIRVVFFLLFFFDYVVLGMFYYYYYFVFGSECFLRAKTVGPPGTVKGQAAHSTSNSLIGVFSSCLVLFSLDEESLACLDIASFY